MRGSLVLHGAAAATVLVHPPAWPWALGAVVADHLAITAAGLVPRSRWLGPNLTRLPGGAGAVVALTVDDGPDPEVTPKVLDLLGAGGVRATFFCIGSRVRQHPALAREIVARGHAIENHSEHHLHRFSLLGPRAMAAEVMRAQESIGAVTGRLPRFFRAPAGLRNPFLTPALAHSGLQLVSWTRRGFDTLTADPGLILARLTHDLGAGDILLVHDGHAARRGASAPAVLTVLPRLLHTLAARQLRAVTLDAALPEAP